MPSVSLSPPVRQSEEGDRVGYLVTPVEAYALMKLSERFGGHPCTRHIGLSNDQLMQRLYNGEGARDGGIQYISTFTTIAEAGKAASQTFKNIDSAAGGGNPVERFQALIAGRSTHTSFTDVRCDEVFKVRFALGSGVRSYYCNHMTLVLFKVPNSRVRFFVRTFYPRPPNELREVPLDGNS